MDKYETRGDSLRKGDQVYRYSDGMPGEVLGKTTKPDGIKRVRIAWDTGREGRVTLRTAGKALAFL